MSGRSDASYALQIRPDVDPPSDDRANPCHEQGCAQDRAAFCAVIWSRISRTTRHRHRGVSEAFLTRVESAFPPARTSGRHRRLIQTQTVRLPPMRTDTRADTAGLSRRFRCAPVQPRVRAMSATSCTRCASSCLQDSRGVADAVHRASVVRRHGFCVGTGLRHGTAAARRPLLHPRDVLSRCFSVPERFGDDPPSQRLDLREQALARSDLLPRTEAVESGGLALFFPRDLPPPGFSLSRDEFSVAALGIQLRAANLSRPFSRDVLRPWRYDCDHIMLHL